MRKSLFIPLLSVFLFSCSNDDWRDELGEVQSEIEFIKEEIASQKALIDALQKRTFISSIEYNKDSYTIKLSDGQSVTLKNGETPVINIGANGNWFINGEDTGTTSKGKDGNPGSTPSIIIGSNGNWIINGSDTGIKANGSDAPIINKVVETQTSFIFYLSDGTSISSIKSNIVVFWGDSLTVGYGGKGVTMPSVVQTHLGKNYTIINAGVGGENSRTIASRQGGNTMTIKDDIQLSSTETTINLIDYEGYRITPLLQGGYSSINPCYVNGIECEMKWTGKRYDDPTGRWTLKSTNDIPKTTIKKGLPIITNYMKNLCRPYCIVIWMGTNGYYSSAEDLIQQYEKMIEYAGTSNFLVIGLQYLNDINNEKVNKALQARFGAKFIDWNFYALNYALDEAGIVPTQQDKDDIAHKTVPSSLRHDPIHLNATGYRILGNIVYRRMKALGYVAE